MANSQSVVDAYGHAAPLPYIELLEREGKGALHLVQTWVRHSPLSDLAARIDLLNSFSIRGQIVTPPVPPVDFLAAAADISPIDLARHYNDSLAEWINEAPDRFAGVGAVSISDADSARLEIDRIVDDLGFVGIQLVCGSELTPLDSLEGETILQHAQARDLAVWLHPFRSIQHPDFDSEERSRNQVGYMIGWPYETTVTAYRLATSGVLQRLPRLRIYLHHSGGFLAALWNRIDMFYSEQWSQVTGHEISGSETLQADLRRFFVDVANGGSQLGVQGAVDFFGPSRIVFGTDSPFGTERGADAFRRAFASIGGLTVDLQSQIESLNVIELLGAHSNEVSAWVEG